jgi:hypothetical protein
VTACVIEGEGWIVLVLAVLSRAVLRRHSEIPLRSYYIVTSNPRRNSIVDKTYSQQKITDALIFTTAC